MSERYFLLFAGIETTVARVSVCGCTNYASDKVSNRAEISLHNQTRVLRVSTTAAATKLASYYEAATTDDLLRYVPPLRTGTLFCGNTTSLLYISPSTKDG